LAKAVDVPSEADFYENLLRCRNGHQRKEKLLSKGIAEAEVGRCLRDYAGPPIPEEQAEPPKKQTEQGGGTKASQPSSAAAEKAETQKTASVEPKETMPGQLQGAADETEQSFRLKDIATVEYIIGKPPPMVETGGGGGGGGGASHEGHTLTDEEKARLEKAGRQLAKRELKNMGFTVEEMPLDNPGFDLRAKKRDEELRIEVKAHLGRATVVDVTQRQYKEYLDQQKYRWELWNVEHLAESESESVVITRYADIPDEALDARTFRVDLKKCHSP